MTKQEQINKLEEDFNLRGKEITRLEKLVYFEKDTGKQNYGSPILEKVSYKDEFKENEIRLARVNGKNSELKERVRNLNQIIQLIISPNNCEDIEGEKEYPTQGSDIN